MEQHTETHTHADTHTQEHAHTHTERERKKGREGGGREGERFVISFLSDLKPVGWVSTIQGQKHHFSITIYFGVVSLIEFPQIHVKT